MKTVAGRMPCYNGKTTIGQVVQDVRRARPDSFIYVYDNNSTDKTFEPALKTGNSVVREYQQGKGNVVRRMFSDIDANIYLIVDGAGTYNSSNAPALINKMTEERADMVVGCRKDQERNA